MQSLEQIVTIELFGQKYSFKAEAGVHDASEVAEVLAKEVANVESQLLQYDTNMNKITILALAALNISSEFIEIKRKYEELLKGVSARTATLAKMIEA